MFSIAFLFIEMILLFLAEIDGFLLLSTFLVLLLMPNVASTFLVLPPAALTPKELIPTVFFRLLDSRDSKLALPIELPDFIRAVWGAMN